MLRRYLVFTMLAGFTAAAMGQASAKAPTIAVLDFNNSALTSDAARYEPFRAGISDMLLTELSRNSKIVLVERARVMKLLEEQDLAKSGRVDPATAARIGKMLGAQYLVTGGFVIDRKERLRLDARAINVETSEVVYVETVSGGADDLLDLTVKLADAMNKGMRLPALPGVKATETSAPQKGRLQSLLLYSTALIEEGRNPGKARDLYNQFLKTSPADFALAQRSRASARLRALGG